MSLSSVTVEPVAFLFLLAVFLEFTALQDLVFIEFCRQNVNDSSSCLSGNITDAARRSADVQTADFFLEYNAILAIFAILSSCTIGAWSDIFGRVVPISLPPTLAIVAQILFIVCSTLRLPVGVIMICAFLNGISGATTSVIANVFGFVSDITEQENRTKRITVLEACLFTGGFAGYSSAAFLIHNFINTKYFIIFSLNLLIHISILIYIWFRLRKIENPQTNRQTLNRNSVCLSPSQMLTLFLAAINTVIKKRPDAGRLKILLLMTCAFLSCFGRRVIISVLFVFVVNKPLAWSTSTYGYFSALISATNSLALVALPLASHFLALHISDVRLAMTGVLSRAVGLFVMGLATSSEVMFLCPLLLVFSEFSIPSIRSMLSKLVQQDERGKIFAVVASLQDVCFLVGGVTLTHLYNWAVRNDFFAGVSFELVAGLQIVAFVLLLFLQFNCISFGDSSLDSEVINQNREDSDDRVLLEN